MKGELDLLDQLEQETGFVRLVLSSGDIVYGKPLIITWAGGDDMIPENMFNPYDNLRGIMQFYRLEEIESFEKCSEEEIPVHFLKQESGFPD